MFIFNLKLNKKLISKILLIFMFTTITIIFFIGVYVIFLKNNNQTLKISDSIKSDDIFEVNENNYANILKASNDDIDSYIGKKVHIIGYIYRLLDFKENQFVIARDMVISPDNQSLVVGFLSEYEKAMDFKDGTWVDIVGEIKKGYFNGDIAMLNIISIKSTQKPEKAFVSAPDDTYIPTSNMF